jgi:hypothetical protein
MSAIDEHDTAPVLARIHLLRHAGELVVGATRELGVVLDAHHGKAIVGQVKQVGNVAEPQKVIVGEQAPNPAIGLQYVSEIAQRSQRPRLTL